MSGWVLKLKRVSMGASITFIAGKRSEIGRSEVPREESLPGFSMGMTIDDVQIIVEDSVFLALKC